MLWLISCNTLSRLVGWFAHLRVPGPILRFAIRRYVRHYGVDLEQAADPVESFENFNAFFTRRLKPGSRPICPGENTIASPVDGVVSQFGAIREGMLTQIKGREYSLSDLLADDEEVAHFEGGCYATLYLSPRHYHRIHSPIDGRVLGYRHIPGRLYPVNDMALPRVDRLFAVNERLVTWMQSDSLGRFALVKVGATSVGSISVAYAPIRTNRCCRKPARVELSEPVAIEKGEEIARFNLGSTVVLLAARGDLIFPDGVGGAEVKMGEELLRLR